jgi:hypothetical protein
LSDGNTAEPLEPDPTSFEAEIAIEKLKRYCDIWAVSITTEECP